VSQRLTAQQAAEPRGVPIPFLSHVLRDDGGEAMGEEESQCGRATFPFSPNVWL
jgi:hypothetical protein